MMSSNGSASGYNHPQTQQEIQPNNPQFSFRDTSLYLNFNKPSPAMYNNQDIDNNSNSNNDNSRVRSSSHKQYISRQGDDYDSPYDSPLNHSSTPYSRSRAASSTNWKSDFISYASFTRSIS